MSRSDEVFSAPLAVPTAAIAIDEAGSKATASTYFVVAAVNLREPGLLAREVKVVRDRTGAG